jgi:hypothetical protein
MKITPTGVWAFDEYLRQLSASIRSLDGTDGRTLARGNARKRVLRVLRSIRRVMDERAPAIIERKGGERLKTFKAREARLLKRGYVPVTGNGSIMAFATAGVPMKRIIHRTHNPGAGWYDQIGVYVPAWAKEIGPDSPTKLRQAKKSVMLQKAVLAEKALRESVMP